MKKAFVSFSILVVFVLYSALIRHQAPVLAKPSSLASGTNKTQSTTTSSPPPTTGSSTTSTGSSTTGSSTTGSSAASTTGSSTVGAASTPTPTTSGQYKDGTFKGSTQNAYWGNVQVAAVVSGGKITKVKILQYPNSHSTSVYINQQALPYLQQETIKSQNANIQIISGATFTSQAFIQSLTDALKSAKA